MADIETLIRGIKATTTEVFTSYAHMECISMLHFIRYGMYQVLCINNIEDTPQLTRSLEDVQIMSFVFELDKKTLTEPEALRRIEDALLTAHKFIAQLATTASLIKCGVVVDSSDISTDDGPRSYTYAITLYYQQFDLVCRSCHPSPKDNADTYRSVQCL